MYHKIQINKISSFFDFKERTDLLIWIWHCNVKNVDVTLVLASQISLLKCKLYAYDIGGKTLKWIDSFLCDRQQRVVMNGVKLEWALVLSGVHQGTVLGPLLFSLYTNDITEDIDSELRFFADDCVCYR